MGVQVSLFSKGWFLFDWWNHLHCTLESVWEVVVEGSLRGKGVLSQGSSRWLRSRLAVVLMICVPTSSLTGKRRVLSFFEATSTGEEV
jgi:hypothetical protein